MRSIYLSIAVVMLLVLGCGKDEAPAADETSTPEQQSGEEQSPADESSEAAAPTPAAEPAAPERYEVGELAHGVQLADLGLTVNHPNNLDVNGTGNSAVLSAEGFYPVTITAQPVTLENARFKVTVNGQEQLAPGTGWDGRTKTIQTACHIIECEVDHPNPYRADVAAAGRAICESIHINAYPTQGALRQIRDSSRSFSGECGDDDRAYGDVYGELVRDQAVQDAVTQCWREAAAANPDWAGMEPRLSITWGVRPSGAWSFEPRISGLEGDTSGLLACFEAAVASVRERLDPDATSSETCHLVSLMATFDMIHEIVCPE